MNKYMKKTYISIYKHNPGSLKLKHISGFDQESNASVQPSRCLKMTCMFAYFKRYHGWRNRKERSTLTASHLSQSMIIRFHLERERERGRYRVAAYQTWADCINPKRKMLPTLPQIAFNEPGFRSAVGQGGGGKRRKEKMFQQLLRII